MFWCFFEEKDTKENNNWSCDINDKNNITSEKINFVYDNAINLLKEINDGFKIIKKRTTLLLSYLGIVVAFLMGNIIIQTLTLKFLYIFSFSLILIYTLLIMYIIVNILIPKLAPSSYNQPSSFLTKEVFEEDINMIKFYETINLQKVINEAILQQNITSKATKKAIQYTFILPFFNILPTFLVCLLIFLLN